MSQFAGSCWQSLRRVRVHFRGQPPSQAEQDMGEGGNLQRREQAGGHYGQGQALQAAGQD